MILKQTSSTKVSEASVTGHSFILLAWLADNPFTMLAGTHLQIRILMSLVPLVDLPVPLLHLAGKLLEEGSISLERIITKGKGTGDHLKLPDPVDGVFVKTVLTVIVPVFAFGDEDIFHAKLFFHAYFASDRLIDFPLERPRQFSHDGGASSDERMILWLVFVSQDLSKASVFGDGLDRCRVMDVVIRIILRRDVDDWAAS